MSGSAHTVFSVSAMVAAPLRSFLCNPDCKASIAAIFVAEGRPRMAASPTFRLVARWATANSPPNVVFSGVAWSTSMKIGRQR